LKNQNFALRVKNTLLLVENPGAEYPWYPSPNQLYTSEIFPNRSPIKTFSSNHKCCLAFAYDRSAPFDFDPSHSKHFNLFSQLKMHPRMAAFRRKTIAPKANVYTSQATRERRPNECSLALQEIEYTCTHVYGEFRMNRIVSQSRG